MMQIENAKLKIEKSDRGITVRSFNFQFSIFNLLTAGASY